MSKNTGKEVPERAALRLRDVQTMTGWPHQYIRKLVAAKVLRVVRAPCSRAWYFESDVRQAMTPH